MKGGPGLNAGRLLDPVKGEWKSKQFKYIICVWQWKEISWCQVNFYSLSFFCIVLALVAYW